jgi:predicted DCC family thiol-disulfide oxidoreductase YuxK
MIRCSRCGCDTPRLTVDQTRCPQCAREVARIVELDAKRRTRFAFAKVLAA